MKTTTPKPKQDEHRPTGPGAQSNPAQERPGQPRAQERFRATARQIVTQLDIEQTMWQILEKEPKR